MSQEDGLGVCVTEEGDVIDPCHFPVTFKQRYLALAGTGTEALMLPVPAGHVHKGPIAVAEDVLQLLVGGCLSEVPLQRFVELTPGADSVPSRQHPLRERRQHVPPLEHFQMHRYWHGAA